MSVKIVKDRQTGQPRGIAFVEMSTQWEGRRAASMLNRTDFMGKNLLVELHGQNPRFLINASMG
jgi:RNA recognition motif-containing protein